ncbi:MAG: endopeptidase La [Lawsonibacter sp.]|nr:endopeptidase La [Lawsonibacter sp.]
MPAIALRGLTVFPNVLIHFEVAREASVKALEAAMTAGSPVFLVGQKDIAVEEPELDDLYQVGTISHIRQILRMPGDNVRVMVEGQARGRVLQLLRTEPYLEAEVREIPAAESPARGSARTEALMRATYELFQNYAELSPKLAPDLMVHVLASQDPGHIADYIAQNIPMRNSDKQSVLEELRPARRLEKLYRLLEREVEILSLDQEIQERAREQMSDHQRDYYLREQIKAIQTELGEEADEIEEYRERIAKADLPNEVREKLNKELGRLAKQSYSSSEGTVLRGYLDVCLELPWGKKTREKVNVSAVRKVLDQDHFGLDKVKNRILEFVAVKQLAPELKGQVLCLVGPPGVGKTSIAMSMAKAMNRKLARVSLGGVSDEAEIRGHRKTYVGAMPGRIISAIHQAKSCNPLILLDEIDKLGYDHRGDPSSALLEVLDGEQNSTFRDNFLEVSFDLSEVLFVTTANTTDTIPRPLLDRMEVIELSSYTDEEKVQIAKKHLLPKEIKRHGLSKGQLRVTDGALREIIAAYTRESGVRVLERRLAAVCRKTAMRVVTDDVKVIHVTDKNLEEFLGVPRYHPERQALEERVGVVNGLAWTSVGGELLEVEVNVVSGSGKVELTGNLGDVMKESAHAALSFIRSQADRLNIPTDFYKEKDIHVHFPEGAVPKDGPSAGIAITTAMVSALTGCPVRRGIAMTGEVTLRGRVLPIGGLKEKTMAAFRNGVRTVIIPADNAKDLEEIDQTVRAALQFVLVERADQVLVHALNRPTEAAPAQKRSHARKSEELPPVPPEPKGDSRLRQ